MSIEIREDWSSWLAEVAQKYGAPGAAMALRRPDGSMVGACTGVVNASTGVAVSIDSVFQIGSVSKVWTTTLLMTYVEEGVIKLDSLVSEYLPELKLTDQATLDSLTVRHLLNHTSGLPGDWFPDTGRGDDCLEKYVALFAELELEAGLEEIPSYSNSAFSLVGRIIERVTGKVWDATLRERIIEPLCLTHTSTLPEEAILHNAAVGHVGLGDTQHVTPMFLLPRNCGPAGTVSSSVEDLLTFGAAHLPGSPGPISEQSKALMQTVTSVMPGGSYSRSSFGLGWMVSTWGDQKVIQHDGATIGQCAGLRVVPEKGIVACLMINGGNWVPLRDEVLRTLFAGYDDLTVPSPPVPLTGGEAEDARVRAGAVETADIAGTYRSNGQQVTVAADSGGGFTMSLLNLDALEELASDGEEPMEAMALVPVAPDTFLYELPGLGYWNPVIFVRDGAGAVKFAHTGGRAARKRG